MSSETKKVVQEVREGSKRLAETAGELARKAATFDKGLSERVQKIAKSADEAVKHIDERSNGKEG